MERGTLKPLNPYRYDPMDTKIAPVGKTGFIAVNYRYYSIPYKYIGKRLRVMYNRPKVEAFNGHELIAVHVRQFGKEK